MNPRFDPDILDPTSDAQLRTLDASGPITTDDHARAEALMTSIIGTDPAVSPSVVAPLRPVRRHRALRVAAAAAAVAAVGTGAFALSTAGAPPAYASWTATPAPVSAADNTVFEQACRDQAKGMIEWFGDGTLTVRLAERRGDFVAMLLTGSGTNEFGPTDANVTCVGVLPVGGTDVTDLNSAAGGGSAAEGYNPSNAFAKPTGAQFYEGGMSQFTMGGSWLGGGGEPASFVNGEVSRDVVALTIHSFDGTSVDASIKDGTYAAWWPGAAFDLSGPMPPSGEGGPRPKLTYDVTLKDGTVLTGVTPTIPR